MTHLLKHGELDWRLGDGHRHAPLADPDRLEDFGMELLRIELEPSASATGLPAGDDGERLVYVITGSGVARIEGGEELPLSRESILWLEPGERCALAAGSDGLEALSVRAPTS